MTTTLALDDSYRPDVDIKVFLEAKFVAIKRDHPPSYRLPESIVALITWFVNNLVNLTCFHSYEVR